MKNAPTTTPPKATNMVFLSGEANPIKLDRDDRRFHVMDNTDTPVEDAFNTWRKGRKFHITPGQEMAMPPAVQAPAQPSPAPQSRTRPYDELGVGNCAGSLCEFELPDLTPITPKEWTLVAFISGCALMAVGCMLVYGVGA